MIPFDQAIKISIQVLAGLAFCHQNNFTHGAISPDHVILSPDSHVTLIGLTPKQSDVALSQDWAQADTQRSLNVSSDLYQASVLFFELLTTNANAVFRQPQYIDTCLLYTSPSPRDLSTSRMPSSA